MNNTVSVGKTTIVGWLGAVLALLPTIIASVEQGEAAATTPDKYLAITGIALATITQIGRYLQAHKMIGLNVSGAVSDFESDVNLPIESAMKAESPPPAPIAA